MGLFGGKKRKFGFFGPSYNRHGQPRTESIFGQGRRHHPILAAVGDVAAAAAGMNPFGPMGAIGASALKGGLEGGVKGAITDAGKGAVYAATAPTIASKLGFTNTPLVGPSSRGINQFVANTTGLNHPSFLHQLGMAGAPSIGGGMGLWGNLGQVGMLDPVISHSTANLAKDMVSQGLDFYQSAQAKKQYAREHPAITTMIENMHLGRHAPQVVNEVIKEKGYRNLDNLNMLEILNLLKPSYSSSNLYKAMAEETTRHPNAYQHAFEQMTHEGDEFVPHKDYYDVVKETMSFGKPKQHYATGGHIKESDTGGQDDDIPAVLPNGSYVMNATDVSLLGDGSSENGAKKLHDFEQHFMRSNIIKPYDTHTMGIKTHTKSLQKSAGIPAKVSNDEYVLHPEVVNALGKGNNARGAKVLDKMRDNLRRQKGVHKILPPKTKSLNYYLPRGVR